ncbi:hypothetical protein ABC895_12415 [Capnocytophaga sputigena]|uniref:hypothetical protein n=1 Tax=Capnocytophaga sputigena TaxID=1019 RepID=UPI0031F55BA0
MKDKNLLASLAVFRELYNKDIDIYSIIAQFLCDLIKSHSLNNFDISQISKLLNDSFEFDIPIPVIKTALQRIEYLNKEGRKYIVDVNKKKESISTEVIDRTNDIKESHNVIFNELSAYVEDKKKIKLSEIEIKELHNNFCNYLLEENIDDKYLEYISSFVIRNQGDKDFFKKINTIREGVILYSGLKYTNDSYNLNEFGNWRKELNIFLDTEIIFHLAGYNGELYKQFAEDFMKFVSEINTNNQKNKKNLINLLYFSEVKDEIDSFFAKAQHILEGRDILNPTVTAMTEIINGCSEKADLLNKKSDLYTLLNRKGIKLYNKKIDVTSEENYKYNIISQEIVEKINRELNTNTGEEILATLNNISILRKEQNDSNFENSRYILLSGNSKTLKIAFEPSVLERFNIPLATNLNFIINRFWFKLNKGFSNKDFPSSFSVLTKSQIILSKVLNDNIGDKYDDLQKKYQKGEITKENAVNRINDLRNVSKKPEEIIKQEIAEEILDFIVLDSTDDYIQQQNHYREKSKNYDKVSTELKEKKEENDSLKRRIINEKRERIKEKKDIISDFEIEKADAEKKSNKKVRILKWTIYLIPVLLLISCIFYFGWDIMEKYTYIIGILSPFILPKFLKEINIASNKIKGKLIFNQIKKKSKYTFEEIKKLKEEIEKLNNEIIDIEK